MFEWLFQPYSALQGYQPGSTVFCVYIDLFFPCFYLP